jgi:hypothetical protein
MSPRMGTNVSWDRCHYPCFGPALTDRYTVLEPHLGRSAALGRRRPDRLSQVSSWYAAGSTGRRPRVWLKRPTADILCPTDVSALDVADAVSDDAADAALADRLDCASKPGALRSAQLLLLIGVPSDHRPISWLRRNASRATWMSLAAPQRPARAGAVLACFVVSSQLPHTELAALRREARAHGDILFVDAPETPSLITKPMLYNGKRGRGLPTFKQCVSWNQTLLIKPQVDG